MRVDDEVRPFGKKYDNSEFEDMAHRFPRSRGVYDERSHRPDSLLGGISVIQKYFSTF